MGRVEHLPNKTRHEIQRTLWKKEKFENYFQVSDLLLEKSNDKSLLASLFCTENEAYESFKKGIFIGAMASGSTPYFQEHENGRFPLDPLVKSVQKKHLTRLTSDGNFDENDESDAYYHQEPQFFRNRHDGPTRFHPTTDNGKSLRKDASNPLRASYGRTNYDRSLSDERNFIERGYLYSLGRTQKYLDRKGMKLALGNYLVRTLDPKGFIFKKDTDNLFPSILKIARLNLKNSVSKKIDLGEPLQNCLNSLVNGYFIENKDIEGQCLEEPKLILEIIVLEEVNKLIHSSLHKETTVPEHSYIDDYEKAMSLMNFAILNLLGKKEVVEDNFYKDIVQTHIPSKFVSKTLKSTSGSDILKETVIRLFVKDPSKIPLEIIPRRKFWEHEIKYLAIPDHEKVKIFQKIEDMFDKKDDWEQFLSFIPTLFTQNQIQNSFDKIVFPFGRFLSFSLPSLTSHKGAYFEWINANIAVTPDFPVALLGRTTDSIYDLSIKEKEDLMKNILAWVTVPLEEDKAKTFIIDLTIEHCDEFGKEDILELILQNEKIIELIFEGKLDLILVKSEQKHASLGTGKFAAGSSCIISKKIAENKDNIIESIDYSIDAAKSIDLLLADFYRKYTTSARGTLIRRQCEIAKQNALASKTRLANGTVFFDREKQSEEKESNSFGFLKESWTNYFGIYRVSPGYKRGLGSPSENQIGF